MNKTLKDWQKATVKSDIDKAIESSISSKYCTALKVIKRLKKEFKNCNCNLETKQQSGIMSTRDYVSIYFTQCMHCKSYKFRQDQIYDFIEKSMNEKESAKKGVAHNINFYK